MPDLDARVIDSVRQQDGRILFAIDDLVIRAHPQQCPKPRLIRPRAELRNVGHSVGSDLGTHRVEHADHGHGGDEEVRPFSHRAANQNAARATAENAEPVGTGPLLRDQPFRAGDEVLPRIRLGGLEAALVPLLPVDTATTRIGDRIDAARIEPCQSAHAVERFLGDTVTRVSVEDRRIAAVERGAAPVNDRHRYHRAVVTFHFNFGGHHVGRRVERTFGLQA